MNDSYLSSHASTKQNFHLRNTSIQSIKSHQGLFSRKSQITQLDQTQEGNGPNDTYINSGLYTPHSPTSQKSAISRHSYIKTSKAKIKQTKQGGDASTKTLKIGAQPDEIDSEVGTTHVVLDSQNKSDPYSSREKLSDDFLNSQEFILQQLSFKFSQTKFQAGYVYFNSILMFVFPIIITIYQLFLLITIQKQVSLIGDQNDDEGNSINIKLSYPLYIVQIIFTLLSNLAIFYVGFSGFKVMRQNLAALKQLEISNYDAKTLEKRYDLYTKSFINNSMIFFVGISLLIACLIGISFINIRKAESEYIQTHKKAHQYEANNGVTEHEQQVLDNLKSWYQYSYLGIALLLIIFFGFYVRTLLRFKTNQMYLENQITTFAMVRNNENYFSDNKKDQDESYSDNTSAMEFKFTPADKTQNTRTNATKNNYTKQYMV
ncbi:UNKNOWN [Stylonychia lemnae]|uniref:Transmembrane protein n=1 Tax=Stylonychia lemnae TaxID=5949 RepID=A0A078A834_STYLE|nr:UNKNOWN [Stylonychia lemnae]|eukprot:CDW78379.1 UNKNOWN [Stylonychia lemnae]